MIEKAIYEKYCPHCKTIQLAKFFCKRGEYLAGYCKECQNEKARIFRAANPEKMKIYYSSEKRAEYDKKWRQNNKEKVRIIQKRCYEKNGTKEWFKLYINDYRKELRVGYVNRTLLDKGFSKETIKENPELVEVQKLIIKTYRLCRTSQN